MSRLVIKEDKASAALHPIKLFKNSTALGVLIAVVTYGIILSIVLTAVSPKRYDIKIGDILQNPIPSPRDVEDKLATQEKIQEAMDSVAPIYQFDQEVSDNTIEGISRIFESIGQIRTMAEDRMTQWLGEQAQDEEISQNSSASPIETHSQEPSEEIQTADQPEGPFTPQFLDHLQQYLPIELSREDVLTCIESDNAELMSLNNKLVTVLKQELLEGIKAEHVSDAVQILKDQIEGMPISSRVKLLGIAIAGQLDIKPNWIIDEQTTDKKKEEVAQNVEKVIYKKGQHIVQAGQPVNEKQIALLRELGILKDYSVDIPLVTGISLAVLVIEMLAIMYIVFFERDLLDKPLMLLMISIIFCLVLGISYVTSLLHFYLIPSAMLGMLLAVLLRPRAAIVINAALTLLLGMMMETQLSVAAVSLAGGMAGVCLARQPQQRNSLIWAGVGVSAVQLLTIISFELISSGGWFDSIKTSLWGVGSGLLASVLTVGTLPIWEHVFGVITPIKLLELSNPNHPILKRLLMEAPGTYHHSIIVANLAENAADQIGANGLLARIGAYYHDIGKLNRPYFFKENQMSFENPHDKLNPSLSAHIITIHPKEGVELAHKFKVPRLIHNFIQQHHGTMPVLFFYHKAKNNDKRNEVKLEDFRYPGPKPSSREIAIVMMADTVEAAVRSLTDPTPDKVESLIRKLIKDRLDDGQLDECDLTLKDLDQIARAFNGVISGIFHQRIEYPDVDWKKENDHEEADGGN